LMVEAPGLRRHWWAAALIGVLAPGLGQLYTGRARFAGYVIAIFVALFALFQTGIPSTFLGFALLFGGALLVSWGSAVEAAAYAWRHPSIERRSYHRWYIYVVCAVLFQGVSTGLNEGLLEPVGQPSVFGAYKPYRASSRALEPSLMDGEYFWVELARGATKRELSDRRGAIVTVRWQGVEGAFVYRLIAVGGQAVALTGGKVLVDGKEIPQQSLCSVAEAGSGQRARRSIETLAGRNYVIQNFDDVDIGRDAEEIALPDDQFFVMGDTRENSNDSRFRGPVANADYGGRALFVIWSKDWSRIGKSLVPGSSVDRADYCPPDAK
jgi:signal peptidase I